MKPLEGLFEFRPAFGFDQAVVCPFGQVIRNTLQGLFREPMNPFVRKACGEPVDRFDCGRQCAARRINDVIGMRHLPLAAIVLDPA
jgi:hypothetical protein